MGAPCTGEVPSARRYALRVRQRSQRSTLAVVRPRIRSAIDPPGADSDAADVFDFVDLDAQTIEHGVELPLAHWLERFPASPAGDRARVAGAYVARATRPPGPRARGARHRSRRRAAHRTVPLAARARPRWPGRGVARRGLAHRAPRRAQDAAAELRRGARRRDRRERLRREAEVVSRLEHPGLRPYHEAELDGEPPYIAMRYVDGETLADAIARARQGAPHGARTALPRREERARARRVLLLRARRARAARRARSRRGAPRREAGQRDGRSTGEPVVLDFGLARDEHASSPSSRCRATCSARPRTCRPSKSAGDAARSTGARTCTRSARACTRRSRSSARSPA